MSEAGNWESRWVVQPRLRETPEAREDIAGLLGGKSLPEVLSQLESLLRRQADPARLPTFLAETCDSFDCSGKNCDPLTCGKFRGSALA